MKNQTIKGMLTFGALFMVMAFNLPEQGNRLLSTIQKRLSEYSKLAGPEKTYLQTDKDRYSSGDTLWFKSYLVDGISHQKSVKSRVSYIELLNKSDSLIATRKMFVNGTSAWGDIVIDTLLPEGNYRLRSYTKYMLNDEKTPLFEKVITVEKKRSTSKKTKSDIPSSTLIMSNAVANQSNFNDGVGLRFFPEGGNLVNGLPGVLGIEAIDAAANGLAVEGSIRTMDGTIVKEFESAEFGLGKVNFTPKPNETYYASIRHDGAERIFDIPTPLKSGYGLN
ncbi:MAG: hypothetical protein KAJ23_18800, partial [Maribacter sp.]|nr:hypothetical protein [Maribacter sp.]